MIATDHTTADTGNLEDDLETLTGDDLKRKKYLQLNKLITNCVKLLKKLL